MLVYFCWGGEKGAFRAEMRWDDGMTFPENWEKNICLKIGGGEGEVEECSRQVGQ